MESARTFDVVVIGGGPAGSMTAYRLAKAGIKVLVLDARQFPRDKPCGGGLQVRALPRLPFDWSPVNRGALNGISFSFRLAKQFTRTYPQPLVHSVLRTEFDEFLLRSAEQAGATVRERTKVTAIRTNADTTEVDTEQGCFVARVVVGADGANGISKQSLNNRTDYYWQTGLSCEVPMDHFASGAIDPNLMRVDWGALPSGYAWIFPKDGFVNVGAGWPNEIGRQGKAYLARFLDSAKMLKPGAAATLAFKGHQLPTMTSSTKLSQGSILLVGDAAGMIEPFTGDGISYGLHGAEIAAEAICRNLDRQRPDLAEYDQQVRHEIGREIHWSRQLLRFYVTFPRLVHQVFVHSDSVWSAFCKILRGEESFRFFRQPARWIPESLWAPLDRLAESCERRRLRDGRIRA